MKLNQRQTFASNAPVTVRQRFAADDTEKKTPITTLMGYPILWGPLSSDRGGYKVRLAPGSANFTEPCLALYHHDFADVLGNTANGTLRVLPADDKGIPVEIDLPDTTTGRDVAELVAKGYIGGMSFSMCNGFEQFTEADDPKEGKIVTCTRFSCDDVTVTGHPAFEATTIAVATDDEDGGEPDEPEDAPIRVAASAKNAQYRLHMLEL